MYLDQIHIVMENPRPKTQQLFIWGPGKNLTIFH